jgi:hypothetical protein
MSLYIVFRKISVFKGLINDSDNFNLTYWGTYHYFKHSGGNNFPERLQSSTKAVKGEIRPVAN